MITLQQELKYLGIPISGEWKKEEKNMSEMQREALDEGREKRWLKKDASKTLENKEKGKEKESSSEQAKEKESSSEEEVNKDKKSSSGKETRHQFSSEDEPNDSKKIETQTDRISNC